VQKFQIKVFAFRMTGTVAGIAEGRIFIEPCAGTIDDL